MRLPVLFSIALSAAALPARTWVKPSADSTADLRLGLLPFPLDECLLPGETKQVHLFEARFIQLFADAASQHSSCIGQLLFTEDGNIASISTLLEVEEYKKEEYGVWARLKCVGRVRLLDLKQTDYQYTLGTVSLFHDGVLGPPAAANADSAAAAAAASSEPDLETRVREVHASTVDMARRLKNAEESEQGDDSDGRVEWGHELRDVEGELTLSLNDMLAARRQVLTSCGPDAAPLPTLSEGLSQVWEASSEAEAESMLLSFAACATLSGPERWSALSMSSATDRLNHALKALEARQQRFAAMLVLKGVASSSE